MKKTLYIISTLAALVMSAGCEKFLDTLPDNRAEVDSIEKVASLLVSAYPDHSYLVISEMCSDNIDDMGESNIYTDRFIEDTYYWRDESESNNDSAEHFWSSSYSAIAHANAALEGLDRIAEETGEWTTLMKELQAEALLSRAYNHFMLVNMFCLNYSQANANALGIPYMEESEHTLNPQYERGTVAEVYEKIEADILAALPNVGDSHLTVPKYHFNPKAAYAFASRFFLFYEKWDLAVKYADMCLGTSPAAMLRNYSELGKMTQDRDAITNEYINANLNCNLLLLTAYSYAGNTFNNYYTWARFSHSPYLASMEHASAMNVWGSSGYHQSPKTYNATNMSRVIFWKVARLFEYTDPVAGIGYVHAVYPAFTGDECLLNRAEAKIMLGQNESAAEDMNMWMKNTIKTYSYEITVDRVNEFYSSIGYAYDDANHIESTQKKHLHPSFTIGAEGSTQENMLQCVLGLKRIENLEFGLRWFDVKRYGIEIPRRVINSSGFPETLVDVLKVDDPRRAIQVPQKVRDAGLQANPR